MEILKERNAGMFKPGQSGNPSGRPRVDLQIREIAREHTDQAIKTLVEIANNPKVSASARVQAANAILDRAWGKPMQYAQNLSVKGTIEDFLDHVSKETQENVLEAVPSEEDDL